MSYFPIANDQGYKWNVVIRIRNLGDRTGEFDHVTDLPVARRAAPRSPRSAGGVPRGSPGSGCTA